MDNPTAERDKSAERVARDSGVRFKAYRDHSGNWVVSIDWSKEHVLLSRVGRTAEDACLKLMYACEELDS